MGKSILTKLLQQHRILDSKIESEELRKTVVEGDLSVRMEQLQGIQDHVDDEMREIGEKGDVIECLRQKCELSKSKELESKLRRIKAMEIQWRNMNLKMGIVHRNLETKGSELRLLEYECLAKANELEANNIEIGNTEQHSPDQEQVCKLEKLFQLKTTQLTRLKASVTAMTLQLSKLGACKANSTAVLKAKELENESSGAFIKALKQVIRCEVTGDALDEMKEIAEKAEVNWRAAEIASRSADLKARQAQIRAKEAEGGKKNAFLMTKAVELEIMAFKKDAYQVEEGGSESIPTSTGDGEAGDTVGTTAESIFAAT